MIRFSKVHKSFGSKSVLRGLSFEVQSGEVYTLLGPNGSGKTTAINILLNLLEADEGSISIGGSPANSATRSQLGVAPQEISLYLDLSVRENLEFFAEVYGLHGSLRRNRVNHGLDLLGLADWASTTVAHLSGGWCRRTNLAAALVSDPAVLILDEPTAGLDIESRHELWGLIEKLRASGVAVLLTTHLLDEAERLSHRIGILKGGRITAEGSLDDLRSEIAAKRVATVHSADPEAVKIIAQRNGWSARDYTGQLTLWIDQPIEFSDLVQSLEGIPLDSLTVLPVGLEHIYVEKSGGFERDQS